MFKFLFKKRETLKEWTKKEKEKNKHPMQVKVLENHFKDPLHTEKNIEILLKEIANDFTKEFWDKEFTIDIRINKKMEIGNDLAAYYCLEDEKGKIEPMCIMISSKVMNTKNSYFVLDVLKHELCHWALSTEGKNFADGEEEFEEELKRIDAKPSEGFRTKDIK